MNSILEWYALAATFFLYIPSLLGVIFGVSLTLGLIARHTLRRSVLLLVASMCVLAFTQVSSAFSQVLMEILLNVQLMNLNTTQI